jgi:hypothetical protein
MFGKTWRVSYGVASVPCRTENDAKLLARELVKKGYDVWADSVDGKAPERVIKTHQIPAWLAEPGPLH